MNRKEQEIQILKAQIEALKSIPEGDLLEERFESRKQKRKKP